METTKNCSLAKAWDAFIDPDSAIVDGKQLSRKGTFLWVTQDHKEIFIEHMTTSHVYNIVRMVYNHTVPARYRIEGGDYPGCARLPLAQRKVIMEKMLIELAQRTDITPHQLQRLKLMQGTFRILATLQLK